MRKIVYLVLIAMSFGTVQLANAGDKKYRYEHSKNQKGNISPEDLPRTAKKYIQEKYPDCTILVSKRKGNGNYYVKVRYEGNQYRPYYRSLVFDHAGKLIKG